MATKSKNAAFEDLSNVEFETSEDVEVVDSFSDMHLKEELTRGIYAYGKCALGKQIAESMLSCLSLYHIFCRMRDYTFRSKIWVINMCLFLSVRFEVIPTSAK